MAEIIKVNPAKLRSTSSEIAGLAADYQALYKKMYTEADAMRSTWSAEDNVAYIKRIREFEEDFRYMHKLMEDYVNYLEQSAAAYEKTQQNVITEAGKLRV